MVHETDRLTSKFTPPSTSSFSLLTQPLSSVTEEVMQAKPSSSLKESLVEEEFANEEDAFEDKFPYGQNYDDVNLFCLDDNTQMPQESPTSPESPIVTVESPLVSTIPQVELRVVTRRAARVVKNKYDNMTFEEIDEYLLQRYPFTSEPGILCIEKFDTLSAAKDFELLVEIDNKKDKNLHHVKAWLQRLRIALIKTRFDSEDELDL